MSEFRATAAMGKRVRGRALVAKDGFSARYDLDRVRGVFSRPEHRLAGQSYVGRILVLDAAKGGVATAWMLHEMAARGVMPAALVLNRVNPIMVQGAALADFTMMILRALSRVSCVPGLKPILEGGSEAASGEMVRSWSMEARPWRTMSRAT